MFLYLFVHFHARQRKKKQNNFVFDNVIFCPLDVLTQPPLKNVSHSNDNRHSEPLFVHGLSKRIHKNLDDCQLLVCFQLRALACHLVNVCLTSARRKSNLLT